MKLSQIITCVVFGLTASTSIAVQPTSSNTVHATRIIQYDAGPQERDAIVKRVGEAAGVGGGLRRFDTVDAAVTATLGVEPLAAGMYYDLDITPASREIIISVYTDRNVQPGSTVKPRATEAADAAVAALIEALTPSSEDLKWAVEKRDQLVNRKNSLLTELHDLESTLRKQSDSVDVSPATIHQLLSSLQTQRESLSLDLVAKQARAEALTDQIAKYSDQLAKKVEQDPVANELEKVVELQQKAADLAEKQQQSGVVSSADANKAAQELAVARAKLLERKSLTASTAGGDTLAAWNKELMNLSVDQAELNARLKAINERLNRLSDAGDMLDRTEQIRARIADVSKELTEAEAEVSDLKFKAERDHVDFKLLPDKSTNEALPTTQPEK